MDQFQRGRSPSVRDLKPSISPSPHRGFDIHNNNTNNADAHDNNPQLTLDPSLLDQPFFTDPFRPQPASDQASFDASSYLAPSAAHQSPPHQSLLSHTFLSAQDPQPPSAFNSTPDQHPSHITSNFQASNVSFDNLDGLGAHYTQHSDQNFDPSLSLDPSLLDSQQEGNALGGNNNLSVEMATMHQHSPEAPHLLQPRARNHSTSSVLSNHSYYEDAFTSPYHSRHGSLEPSSAAYPQLSSYEWSGSAYTGHRQAPSDQHSDVSSSAQPSPFLGNQDSFDPVIQQPSPLLNSTEDPYLGGLPDMDRFTLSEQQLQQPQHISQGPSPHLSPYLTAQPMSSFNNADGFSSNNNSNNDFAGPNGDSYGTQEAFPAMTTEGDSTEFSGPMSPPEINIELAPDARHTHVSPPQFGDTLFPPAHRSPRQRPRAISDPYATSNLARNPSPSRSRSPSLQPTASLSTRPRSVSPGFPAAGISKANSRRSSSPSFPSDRDYMLNLVHRQGSEQPSNGTQSSTGSPSANEGSNGSSAKRGQKHPSTFHCTLCTKSFTRAYNLRSHLRTHTDERPFVCTVCGKAFARQHDRKRHESLHSGEKRFVCRGTLGAGVQWGCGRGFARADALGRHFRSEAGRACIKPLLDEEAREREAAMMEANMDMMNHQHGIQSMPQGMSGPVDPSSMPLPTALLQMYPALAEIQWNSMPATINEGDWSGMDDSDYENGRRGSFDASSGGEYYDEEENGIVGGTSMAPSYPTWS